MKPDLCSQLLDHRFVGVWYKNHRMRHARVEGVDLKFAGTDRHQLVEFQILRWRQIHSDPVALECSCDNTGARFKSRWAICARLARHESRETTRPVAAHLGRAPVAIIEFPGPLGFAGSIWHQQEKPISADPALTVTKTNDLIAGKLDLALTIIDEHKVVPGAVHLRKVHHHDGSNLAKKGGVQRRKLSSSCSTTYEWHRSTPLLSILLICR